MSFPWVIQRRNVICTFTYEDPVLKSSICFRLCEGRQRRCFVSRWGCLFSRAASCSGRSLSPEHWEVQFIFFNYSLSPLAFCFSSSPSKPATCLMQLYSPFQILSSGKKVGFFFFKINKQMDRDVLTNSYAHGFTMSRVSLASPLCHSRHLLTSSSPSNWAPLLAPTYNLS